MNNFFPKKVISLAIILFCLFLVDAYSSVFNKKLILNQKQEELIDGGVASQTYIFNFDGDKAFLKIKSWHSMYSCDGNYVAINENGTISLSWNVSVNGKDYLCDSPSPQFKIKIKNNKFYLNSQLLKDKNEWYLMTEK
ncbi:hypothetical protein [Aeromonas hydrophila]|uniref:hypothetical protein n=1 Tax=Aeromonas hydrophila TaxID=644 RepID=UPI002B48E4FA|nr:hypothetical protein [Aeromonas hydrophila]